MILTSDGKLKLCSRSNNYVVDIKAIINENAPKSELKNIIRIYNEVKFQNLWWGNIGSDNK